jgi:hypothetical protein
LSIAALSISAKAAALIPRRPLRFGAGARLRLTSPEAFANNGAARAHSVGRNA